MESIGFGDDVISLKMLFYKEHLGSCFDMHSPSQFCEMPAASESGEMRKL